MGFRCQCFQTFHSQHLTNKSSTYTKQETIHTTTFHRRMQHDMTVTGILGFRTPGPWYGASGFRIWSGDPKPSKNFTNFVLTLQKAIRRSFKNFFCPTMQKSLLCFYSCNFRRKWPPPSFGPRPVLTSCIGAGFIRITTFLQKGTFERKLDSWSPAVGHSFLGLVVWVPQPKSWTGAWCSPSPKRHEESLLLVCIFRRGSRILVRGAQQSFGPKGGALSPKFAQIGGFPLTLPENCMIFKKSWGQGGLGPQAPLDPLLILWI